MKAIIRRLFLISIICFLSGACSSDNDSDPPSNSTDNQNPVITSLSIIQTDADNDGNMDDLEGQLDASDNVGVTSRKVEIRDNNGTLITSANPSQNGGFEILDFSGVGAFSGTAIVRDNAGNEATRTISFEVFPQIEYQLSLTVELDPSVLIDGTEAGTVIGQATPTATADGEPYANGTIEFTIFDDLLEINTDGQISLLEELDIEDSTGFDIYTHISAFVVAELYDDQGVQRATAEASDLKPVEDIDDFLNKYGIVIEIDGHQHKYNIGVNSAQSLDILIINVGHEVVVSSIANKSPLLGIREDPNLSGFFYVTFDINQDGNYYIISPLDMSRILFVIDEAKNPGDTQSVFDKIINNTGDITQMIADFIVSDLTTFEIVVLSDGSTGLDMNNRDGGEIGAGAEYEAIRNQGGTPMN